MIFPMIIPGPTRYVDRFHDSGAASAVNSLRHSQDVNHRELLGAIKKIGENKLAVTVVASEILPLATAAFNYLDGPCRDYDKARSKWELRFYEAKRYLRKRKEREKERVKEAKNKEQIDAYLKENLKKAMDADAREHVRRNSSWFRGLPYHEAYKLVEDRKCPTPNVDKVMAWTPTDKLDPYDMSLMYEHRMEMMELQMGAYGKSAPKKPDGHAVLPAIREVYEAASTTPNAMLTIPAETVRAIGKFSEIAGNVVVPCCDSCGSKNFKRFDGIRICSYCRSES